MLPDYLYKGTQDWLISVSLEKTKLLKQLLEKKCLGWQFVRLECCLWVEGWSALEATKSWCSLPVLPSAHTFTDGGYAAVVITKEINGNHFKKSSGWETFTGMSYSNVNILLIIRSVRVEEWCLFFWDFRELGGLQSSLVPLHARYADSCCGHSGQLCVVILQLKFLWFLFFLPLKPLQLEKVKRSILRLKYFMFSVNMSSLFRYLTVADDIVQCGSCFFNAHDAI